MSQSSVKRYLGMALVILSVVVAVTFIVNLAARPKMSERPDLPVAAKQELNPDEGVQILVTNSQGEPVRGARVSTGWFLKDDNEWHSSQFVSDAEGTGFIALDRSRCVYFEFTISSHHEPTIYLNNGARGSRSLLEIPAEFPVKLPAGKTIGGQVVDQNDNPVSSVKVDIEAWDRNVENPCPDLAREFRLFREQTVSTTRNGRWELKGVPAGMDFITVNYSHSKHKNLPGRASSRLGTEAQKQLATKQYVHTMEKGIQLTGRVTDEEGNPVSGAFVTLGTDVPGRAVIPRTNPQGYFNYENAQLGTTVLSVLSSEFAPWQKSIEIKQTNKQQDVVLKQGTPLKLRVVDEAGKPLPDVTVLPYVWGEEDQLNYNLSALYNRKQLTRNLTDSQGVFVWENAPSVPVGVNVSSEGFMTGTDSITPDGEIHEVALSRFKVLNIKIVDAETKELIPDFRYQFGQVYQFGSESSFIEWGRSSITEGKQGQFTYPLRQVDQQIVFKVMASGYKAHQSQVIKTGELQKAGYEVIVQLEKGTGPTGTVFTTEGKPVSDARVILYQAGRTASISNGKTSRWDRSPRTNTNKKGEFKFEPQLERYGVFIMHEAGYANLLDQELEQTNKIKLKPWATIKGTLYERGKAVAGRRVRAETQLKPVKQGTPVIMFEHHAETNETGQFELEKVVGEVQYNLGQESKSERGNQSPGVQRSAIQQLQITAGTSYDIKLGGEGRPVTGKVELPTDKQIAHSNHRIVEAPTDVAQTNIALGGLFSALKNAAGIEQSEEPANVNQFLRSFEFSLDENGAFRVEEIPPGKYQVYIELREQQGRGWGGIVGLGMHEFEIPEIEGGFSEEPLDLGTIDLPGQVQAVEDIEEELIVE